MTLCVGEKHFFHQSNMAKKVIYFNLIFFLIGSRILPLAQRVNNKLACVSSL